MQFRDLAELLTFWKIQGHASDHFWNLAHRHEKLLYNVAFKFTGNRFDAEDLVQETLYIGLKKIHQLRDDNKFKSWIFTIMRNYYLKAFHKKKKISLNLFDDEVNYIDFLHSIAETETIEMLYERKERSKIIQLVLDGMPEKYKSVLILYYMDDFSYKEIAEILNKPIGTVMSRLSRGKQLFKKAFLKLKLSENYSKSSNRQPLRGDFI